MPSHCEAIAKTSNQSCRMEYPDREFDKEEDVSLLEKFVDESGCVMKMEHRSLERLVALLNLLLGRRSGGRRSGLCTKERILALQPLRRSLGEEGLGLNPVCHKSRQSDLLQRKHKEAKTALRTFPPACCAERSA